MCVLGGHRSGRKGRDCDGLAEMQLLEHLVREEGARVDLVVLEGLVDALVQVVELVLQVEVVHGVERVRCLTRWDWLGFGRDRRAAFRLRSLHSLTRDH